MELSFLYWGRIRSPKPNEERGGGYKNTAHIARMPGLVVLPGSGHGRSRSDFPEAFSTATMNPILSDLANFPPFFFYLG